MNIMMIATFRHHYLSHNRSGGSPWQSDQRMALDPEYLETLWDMRLSNKAFFLAAGYLNAFAWLFFTIPIIQLAWTLSRHGTRDVWLLGISVGLVLFGGLTEWVSRFFWTGEYSTSESLVNEYNIDQWLREDIAMMVLNTTHDGMGWRALEVTYMLARGFIWYVDSFEWICLSGILIAIYAGVRRWRAEDSTTFGGCWNSIGLFMGILCIFEFAADLVRFNNSSRTFGLISFSYGVVNRLILMPIWLLTLSVSLPRAIVKQSYGATDYHPGDPGDLGLTEMDGGIGDRGVPEHAGPSNIVEPPTFTIDD